LEVIKTESKKHADFLELEGFYSMPLEIEPIESDMLHDQVLDAIERALVSSSLRPGDRINEAEIARQAGISRGPVREAIQQLVGEGILMKIPHRGTFVAQWTKEDIAETYGLRALLESFAASMACSHMSEVDSEELKEIVREMFECAHRGDSACLSELDSRFHRRLYEFSGHKLLQRILNDLWRRVSMLVSFDAETSPDLVEYAENHQMLLEAIVSRNGDEIETVFREHIIGVGNALIERMESQVEVESN
jgi:DNA-binding GntR family transcriptional regulator